MDADWSGERKSTKKGKKIVKNRNNEWSRLNEEVVSTYAFVLPT